MEKELDGEKMIDFVMKLQLEDGTTDELSEIIRVYIDELVKAFHIAYETAKDISTISDNKLNAYLTEKEIDPIMFGLRYDDSLEQSVKMMALFAIMNKHNVSLSDPEAAINLLTGSFDRDLVVSLDTLDGEVLDILSDILGDDFELDILNPEVAQLIEEYHNNYMQENIYPKKFYSRNN